MRTKIVNIWCCKMHCQLSFHHNLHHTFDEDSIIRPVQLGELDEFAWEEVDAYSLASDGLWDNINMDEVLGTLDIVPTLFGSLLK